MLRQASYPYLSLKEQSKPTNVSMPSSHLLLPLCCDCQGSEVCMCKVRDKKLPPWPKQRLCRPAQESESEPENWQVRPHHNVVAAEAYKIAQNAFARRTARQWQLLRSSYSTLIHPCW